MHVLYTVYMYTKNYTIISSREYTADGIKMVESFGDVENNIYNINS